MDNSFEGIKARMLAKVPDYIDKREGSIIYDTTSAVAYELAEKHSQDEANIDLTFANTAVDTYLDRYCSQFGVVREQGVNLKVKLLFFDTTNAPIDVPENVAWILDEYRFEIQDRISTGVYIAMCTTTGSSPNQITGSLTPESPVSGIGQATIGETVVPGKDKESDRDYYDRFREHMSRPAFGGNVPQYERETLSLEGVGNVKVFPVYNGPTTVGIVVGNNEGQPVSLETLAQVQQHFSPETGMCIIGHDVTVINCQSVPVNVNIHVALRNGWTLDDVQSYIVKEITDVINNIQFTDATLHVSRLMAAALKVESVVDVPTVTINDQTTNLALRKDFNNYQVPTVAQITVEVV